MEYMVSMYKDLSIIPYIFPAVALDPSIKLPDLYPKWFKYVW